MQFSKKGKLKKEKEEEDEVDQYRPVLSGLREKVPTPASASTSTAPVYKWRAN